MIYPPVSSIICIQEILFFSLTLCSGNKLAPSSAQCLSHAFAHSLGPYFLVVATVALP
jgi:hypothetical protein